MVKSVKNRKKNNKTRKNKNKQKGGHVVEIENEKLINWRPLCSFEGDCGYNVFSFLDYLDRSIVERIANTNKTVIDLFTIMEELNRIYNISHSLTIVGTIENGLDYKTIQKIIQPNTGTICFLYRDVNTIGHYVVLMRNELGYIDIVDPQRNIVYKGTHMNNIFDITHINNMVESPHMNKIFKTKHINTIFKNTQTTKIMLIHQTDISEIYEYIDDDYDDTEML